MKRQALETKKSREKLMHEILQTKLALEIAYANFEYAIDPDLIDCYIYQMNAVQKRYKYLIRLAKESDLTNVEQELSM